MNNDTEYTAGPMQPIEHEVAKGLRFAHLMLLATERQEKETVRLVESLSKLLIDKGIISDAEWADALRNLPGF